MSETEKDKLENEVDESKTDEKVDASKTEEKTNMNPDGTAIGPSPGFLESMKEKFWPKKKTESEDTEVDEDVVDDVTSSDKTDEIAEVDKQLKQKISDDFINAARLANWSDSQIINFAENKTNEELNSLISFLEESKPPEQTSKEKEITDALNISDEVWNELKESNPTLVEKILQPLVDENKNLKVNMNTLKESLGAVHQTEIQKQAREMEDAANEFFDKIAEKFPVFGKTEELGRFPDGRIVPQGVAFDARNEVWGKATRLFKTGDDKYTFRNAMQDAMDMYAGKHLEENVKQKVVKDIKKKSEDLTPKKSRKNVVESYESDEEKKIAVVKKAAEAAGINFNG